MKKSDVPLSVPDMPSKDITISLTNAEALVLFEALSVLEENQWTQSPDEIELKVLWQIEAQLDKLLVEQFSPEYKRILAEAKAQVKRRSSSGGDLHHRDVRS